MSRSPSLGSWTLPLLLAAALVTAVAIGRAVVAAGLSRAETLAGGVLLLALLAVSAWTVRRRAGAGAEGEADTGAAAADPYRLEDRRALDRLAGRLAAAERPAAVQEAGLHDPLTRLPGRALLLELLRKQVAQARRSGEPVGLVLCDIDDLRAINESHGQEIGDRLLREVARRLSRDVREADTVARTGEDEFTLIVGRAESAADIHQVAQRLLAGVRRPLEIAGREIRISVSVGVSVFPTDAEQPDQLLDNVETALAAATAQGGNCVRVFDGDMRQSRRRP